MMNLIIEEVMEDEQLEVDTIQRFRRQTVRGYGCFFCDCSGEEGTVWSSYYAWVTIDLYQQRIVKRFQQKCLKCGDQCRPQWHEEEFEDMIRFAIRRYRQQLEGKLPRRRGKKQGTEGKAPHKSELCERCGFGQTKCWL